jgi:hypothetical protein
MDVHTTEYIPAFPRYLYCVTEASSLSSAVLVTLQHLHVVGALQLLKSNLLIRGRVLTRNSAVLHYSVLYVSC